mmetsp:Transcript_25968/g.56388  ORF Transcript_25968/g.56388 Transcript_25968/m.56388 type:complete len:96 (-) Transcript_25968:144-431(-)
MCSLVCYPQLWWQEVSYTYPVLERIANGSVSDRHFSGIGWASPAPLTHLLKGRFKASPEQEECTIGSVPVAAGLFGGYRSFRPFSLCECLCRVMT